MGFGWVCVVGFGCLSCVFWGFGIGDFRGVDFGGFRVSRPDLGG